MAIVPDKPKMCLEENLVDCADCGLWRSGEKSLFMEKLIKMEDMTWQKIGNSIDSLIYVNFMDE